MEERGLLVMLQVLTSDQVSLAPAAFLQLF
jgi:hypothetical protein